MNNSDRKRLKRIHACMAIPGCHSGVSSQSMSVLGATGYAHDVSYAMPKVRELLYIVGVGEEWEGQFEERMEELQGWYETRVAQDWAHPSTLAQKEKG